MRRLSSISLDTPAVAHLPLLNDRATAPARALMDAAALPSSASSAFRPVGRKVHAFAGGDAIIHYGLRDDLATPLPPPRFISQGDDDEEGAAMRKPLAIMMLLAVLAKTLDCRRLKRRFSPRAMLMMIGVDLPPWSTRQPTSRLPLP